MTGGGVDYSRFDAVKDPDQEEKSRSAEAVPEEQTTTIKVQKQDAFGSSWNANSWHHEEKNYDAWGKQRLNELLDKSKFGGLDLEHQGQEFKVDIELAIDKLTGEAWSQIRRGKKLTCYNYEMKLNFTGAIHGGSNKWDLGGSLLYDITVDDEDPDVVFDFKQRYPFQRGVEKLVLRCIASKFKIFVEELSNKGSGKKEGFAAHTEARIQVGQYTKYAAGPDGVASLQQTAIKYSESKKASGQMHNGKQLHSNTPTL